MLIIASHKHTFTIYAHDSTVNLDNVVKMIKIEFDVLIQHLTSRVYYWIKMLDEQ